MKIKELILNESPAELKKEIINQVKQIDNETLLQKVLVTLKSSDLSDRLANILTSETGNLNDQIAAVIISTDGTVQEKIQFAENYKKGFINTKALLSGSRLSFEQFVTPGFPTRVFEALSTVGGQGVGPFEISFTVLDPKIKWSGRKGGGGDIVVDGAKVEVKSRATIKSRGGRWLDARKAKLNMSKIRETLEEAFNEIDPKKSVVVPGRLSIDVWVDHMRPILETKPALLKKSVNALADGLFVHANNSEYKRALTNGSKDDIVKAIAKVGFDNYKAYSHFDGILIMDAVTKEGQYFKDWSQMDDFVKVATAYILAPESEAMPQIGLKSQSELKATKPKEPTPKAPPKKLASLKKASKEVKQVKKTAAKKPAGRAKR